MAEHGLDDLIAHLNESLGAFLAVHNITRKATPLVALVAVEPVGGATIRLPFTAEALAELDLALLAACSRGRCVECGIASPADDPFEPGNEYGWICEACEH